MKNDAEPFDPFSTKLRPLAEYRDRIPSRRRGRRLNRATLWRWALHGARGGRVLLRTVCIGGGRFTTDADLDAFMRAIAELDARLDPPARGHDVDHERIGALRSQWREP